MKIIKYTITPISKRISFIVVSGLLFSILFVSCESHEQKADAFDRFKEAKSAEADTVIIVKEVPAPQKKPKTIIINECSSEWLKYRNDTEKKIRENEEVIKILRENNNKDGKNSKVDKNISRLEDKNNEMRKKLDKYNDEFNKKLEKLKETINEENNDIINGLKEISSAKN